MVDHAAEAVLSSSESEGDHHEEPFESASEVASLACKVAPASTVAQPLASQAPPALTEFERQRGQLHNMEPYGGQWVWYQLARNGCLVWAA